MNTRASNGGGTVTQVDQGMVARIKSGFDSIKGWFGPGQPMPPVAPPEVKEEGRALDYPVGYNQNLAPRALEPASFSQLRVLAESYDLMRLVIETRKDQIARKKWHIKPKGAKKLADSRCMAIEEALQKPDNEHNWDRWVSALVEEMLVIDAATIYPRKTVGGGHYSLDLIDGATIKRVIGSDGRTPLPPNPAYQQIIKGVVAAEFRRDELLYAVRNWRVHRVYGFSPVEQVLMTVNIALRRQISTMQYYTEGNIPEALVGVPENWTTLQIREFQEYWDSILEGHTAKRRKMKFVPGGLHYQPTKDSVLKDVFDEWLARVICFAFSVSPNAFIAQVNRATAEVSQAAALEEGQEPTMIWIKGVMDDVIASVFKAPDLEFSWAEEKVVDPAKQATIYETFVRAKILHPDEVRDELGRAPMTPEQRASLSASQPAPNQTPEQQGGGQQQQADKVAKGGSRPKSSRPAPIKRDRRAAKDAEKAIHSAIKKGLASVLKEAIDACQDIGKAATEGATIAAALRLAGFDAMAEALADIYLDLLKDAGREALTQIDMNDHSIVKQVNEKAVEWAKYHAAELVGKRWVDGELVDNPNAAYRIDQVTRDGVRASVEQAIAEGWSNDRLAAALSESYAFSDERAALIATTETAYADVAGNMIAYRESGVVKGKQWIIGDQDRVCDECQANADQGAIPFNDPFESGHLCPPLHPRCLCDVIPLTTDPEEND